MTHRHFGHQVNTETYYEPDPEDMDGSIISADKKSYSISQRPCTLENLVYVDIQ
jgi:hypothetical protein